MTKQSELISTYLEKISQCEREVKLLTSFNSHRVISICKKKLCDLSETDALFTDEEDFQEVFRINKQAFEILLEYSDIFQLKDPETFKKHCLTLLNNFRLMLGEKSKYYELIYKVNRRQNGFSSSR